MHDKNDGIKQASETSVWSIVGKDVREPGVHERGAESKEKRAGQDESVAACNGVQTGNDCDTRHGNRGEQKGGHASNNGLGNGNKRGSKLGKDTHNDEEKAVPVTNLSVGALGDGDDTVVLGKGGHGGNGHERGEEAVQAVGSKTTLDPALVNRTSDLETGNVAGGCDVANGLHHANNVDRQHG